MKIMAKEFDVAAQVKIYLDDPSKMEQAKKDVETVAKINKLWEEDIGFGIKILKVNFLLSDSDGGMDKLEESLRKINNVSEIEVEAVTRV